MTTRPRAPVRIQAVMTEAASAFLGGMTGTLYKQFAVTIAISVTISGLVALTLSPALAALILKPGTNTIEIRNLGKRGINFGYIDLKRLN